MASSIAFVGGTTPGNLNLPNMGQHVVNGMKGSICANWALRARWSLMPLHLLEFSRQLENKLLSRDESVWKHNPNLDSSFLHLHHVSWSQT